MAPKDGLLKKYLKNQQTQEESKVRTSMGYAIDK